MRGVLTEKEPCGIMEGNEENRSRGHQGRWDNPRNWLTDTRYQRLFEAVRRISLLKL